MIPGVGGHQWLEIRTRFSEVHQLVPRDRLITLNLWRTNYVLTRKRYIRFLMEIWERACYAWSLFHSLMIWATETSHTLWRLYPDLSDKTTVSSLYVDGGQSLALQYDTGTKYQGMEWRIKSSPKPKTLHNILCTVTTQQH